ncbi:hypothetical protein [Promicromonospora sukumoe]|uniref:Pilus assembly protein CpaF n=1 Tax=Promicromonospora sukumoe TaxID=88382 RepID=A0A7W3J519_9MICO|nr:hypothetical protein [Promicromonospora sukumoe]MBA8806345.1 hypothetical protein [Promicromonospora sukumoe]
MGDEGARILEHEVRELVRRRGLDPIGDRAGLSTLVTDAVGDYETRASVGVVPPLDDPGAAARAVTDAVGGFGPLQPYLDDPEIEEVWLNAPSRAANLLSQPGVLTRVTLLSEGRAVGSVLD